MNENEITEVEVVDMPMELSVFDPLDAQIAEAKTKNESLAFDYHDKKGNKDARSWLLVLRKLKAPVIEMHHIGKAEALAYCKKWDEAKKKRLTAIENMIEYHHKPIKLIEDAEKAKKAEEERIAQEQADAEESARLAEIEEREKAAAVKEAELKVKQDELERKEREKAIADDAENQARRAAQVELQKSRQIAIQADESRKREAVAAENARKQAIVEAENAKAAAVQKARDDAAAEVAENKRIDEIESARLRKQKADAAANVEHRKQIHRAIYSTFTMGDWPDMMSDEQSQALTQALIDGKIPNVTINY